MTQPQPPPDQPFRNEDGSWSHPALPGVSFRLLREAQAAALRHTTLLIRP